MRIKTLLLLVLMSSQAWGQFTAVVKDANGVALGFPLNSSGLILRSDSVQVSVNMFGGDVSISAFLYYATADCTDPSYFKYGGLGGASETFSQRIITERNDGPLRPLYLIPAKQFGGDFVVTEIFPLSAISGDGTCVDVGADNPLQVFRADTFKIDDPTLQGFRVNPETNKWGYPGPLTIEAVRSEVIYCNSFESCPSP